MKETISYTQSVIKLNAKNMKVIWVSLLYILGTAGIISSIIIYNNFGWIPYLISFFGGALINFFTTIYTVKHINTLFD